MKNKVPWSLAAKDGLLLSIITIVIEVPVTIFQNSMPAYLSSLLLFVKIAGSYTLLFYFTKKYANTLECTGYSDGFKYALATSFFSSIVCTLAMLLTVTVLVPNTIPDLLDQMFAIWDTMGMAEMLDYNSILKMMPAILTFSTIIRCIIWGIIFSLIIANLTKTKTNPFNNINNNRDNNFANNSDDNIGKE